MTDTDIRDALDRATRHLSADADLLDQVRRGGHGRLIRRRAVLVGVAAVAAAGASTALWSRGGDAAPTGTWLLDRPTAGDLADDDRYLRQVRQAWLREYGDAANRSALLGDLHVVWAGTTPAGPAAYVAQRDTSAPDGSLSLTVSFVEPTADGPRLLCPGDFTPGDPTATLPRAALLGARRDCLVVLDTGEPTRWSPQMQHLSDGRVHRAFAPLPFTDGAAVLTVAPQADRLSVALNAGTVNAEVPVTVVNAVVMEVDAGTAQGAEQHHRELPAPRGVWPADPEQADAEAVAWTDAPLLPYEDRFGHLPQVAVASFFIRGATPDGRRLVLRTVSGYDFRMRIFVLIGPTDGPVRVVPGGDVDPRRALPVAVRLPGDAGVVVAGPAATLQYRTARGEWLGVRGDAALLPASAARVRVTRHDGVVSEMDLP